MADNMNGLKRTHYCGEVVNEGEDVVVGGFVAKIRDLGRRYAAAGAVYGSLCPRTENAHDIHYRVCGLFAAGQSR